MGAGAPAPAGTDEGFAAYLAAKHAAEVDLRGRDLDWTILRPGGLTDEPGQGMVQLDESVPSGSIPREDVAAVLAAILHEPASAGLTVELVQGVVPVDAAVAAVIDRAS